MRVIGLECSRTVAEIAYLEKGKIRPGGRVTLDQANLARFAFELRADDHVVLEATGSTAAIVAALQAHVARVPIANPLKVRLIAEARVKTDKTPPPRAALRQRLLRTRRSMPPCRAFPLS